MKISIIGLGLIGSSIARALCEKHDIIAYNRSEKTRERALQLGIISECYDNLKDAVNQADIVIICTPLTTYEPILKEVAKYIKPNAIITDVGSVKTIAVELGNKYIGVENFIGGHPIAGTENSGVDAGFAELFQNKKVILTQSTINKNASILKEMWEEMGANVEYMAHEKHDIIYAFVSHLAQFICWVCLSDKLDKSENKQHNDKYLNQFYRIGASDTKMWNDIFLHNKQPLARALNCFDNVLEEIKSADKSELINIFTEAQSLRKKIHIKNNLNMESLVLNEDYLLPVIVSFAYAKIVYNMGRNRAIPIADYTCTGFADMTLFALCDIEKSAELVLNSNSLEIINRLKEKLPKVRKAYAI